MTDEPQGEHPAVALKRPGVVEPDASEPRLLSELAPMFSRSRRTWFKSDYLVAGVLTTLASIALLIVINGGSPGGFRAILATYLASICFYCLYVIADKRRSLWACVGAALFTFLILFSPIFDLIAFVFRDILPGNMGDNDPVDVASFVKAFFGAGLCEELTKALPVLIALGIGRMLHSPWRERVGITGPLEGLIIGAASACGFTLHETMTQYVPRIMKDVGQHLGDAGGALYGLELEIPRILGEVSGHMAWAGYLGYAIGLAVVRKRERVQIVLGAWLIAAALHGAWDTFSDYGSSLSLLTIVPVAIGCGSFLLLLSATLRARSIEPPPAPPARVPAPAA